MGPNLALPDTNPERHGLRVAAFNQLVRAFITLGFTGAFMWGFLVAHTISGEVFTNLVVLAVTFWFSQGPTPPRRPAPPPNGLNSVNGPPPPPPASAPETGPPPKP